MAHTSSPQKLPRGKTDTYNLVALSNTAATTPLLSGLSIATCNPSIEQNTAPQPEPLESHTDVTSGDVDGVVTVSTRMSCACCDIQFSHRTEQKAHFKSDWHRYNLKQQLRGEASITEEAFEARTGDVSSISGSEDTSTSSTEDDAGGNPSSVPRRLKRLQQIRDSNDSSDSEGEDNSAIMAATRRHPKVFLRNGDGQLISLYRCVLYHKKWAPSTPAELLSLAEGAKNYTQVAMVMLAGGHFSAAIFHGTEAVVHKTFHRYVVRAKRGTVQSVRDSQGSAPKSGGASLRRYNEAALYQEIQELLAGWAPQLQTCHLIFLRTSAYSRHVFFSGKTPILNKDDPRVRTIPFTTGRPTFNEAKRVHHMLMAVECFGDESLVTGFVPVSPPRHLHPETGQLVVRPDMAKSGREAKAKDRKDKGDTTQGDGKQDQEEAARTPDAEADQGESDREVELVTVTEEISTQELQEFASSMGSPKRNRKKKKKGGQRSVPSDRELAQHTAQDHSAQESQPQLSEEDTHLKNRLYTCCKSGDVAQLTQLLQELRAHTHHDTASSSTNPHPVHATTAHSHQCSNLRQLQSHSPSPSSSSTSPESIAAPHDSQATQSVPSHSVENARTCSADIVGERTADRVGEENRTPEGIVCKGEQQSSEAETSAEHNPDTESCDQHSVISRTSQTTSNSEHSLKAGLDSSQTCPSSAKFSQSPAVSQNLHVPGSEGVSHGVVVVERANQKFEAVVMGRYGDRGSSLLHIAASSGHGDIISTLLDAGCDPCVRDSSDKTPYSVASTKDIRNVFRRFRGNHPHLYNYDSAQIPEALTAEMEQERKQREAEKRKQQKKAKQERLKERKAEEAKAAQEQKEKSRFLALSDREKRALAAERRILAQASQQGAIVVLIRCFQCGVDMTGKVPFEYMDFKFCSPRCLKEHRMKSAQ